MREWDVVVSNIVEEMNLFLLQEKTCGDGVNGSIAPTFVEESTILVKSLEVIQVCFGSQPVEIANFEIGPLQLDQ